MILSLILLTLLTDYVLPELKQTKPNQKLLKQTKICPCSKNISQYFITNIKNKRLIKNE